MSLVLPEKDDFEITPAGTHVATCYRVIDLGTQLIDFKGETKKQYKIMISWELTDEKMKDGRPFSIHKKYTLSSSHKATLRKDLESWRGVAFKDEDFGKFDIGVLLGKSCFLGVVHNSSDGNIYANISSLMKLPKTVTVSPLENPKIYFSLNAFDQTLYESLSDNLKATIAKSPEYQILKGGNINDPNVADDKHDMVNDEVPF